MHQLPKMKSLLSTSWKVFQKNWKFIISAALLTLFIVAILEALNRFLDQYLVLGIIGTILSILVSLVITLGWAKVLLRLVRDQSVHLNHFKTKVTELSGYIVAVIIYTFYRLIPMLLVAPFLFFLIISIINSTALKTINPIYILCALVGLALLVWLSIKYIFIEYVAVENTTLSGFEILKKTSSITKGNMMPLLGYSIVFGLINILGFICLIVGLFITVPVTKMAMTKIYDSLKEKVTA